jgi:restriction system protein
LALTKGSEKFLVQCKQWKAFKVGVDVVRELYGVMAAKGATGGFVVTSGRFTDDAKAFADGRNVQLVDGPKLFAMIKQAKQSLTPNLQQPIGKPQMAQHKTAIEPICPQCGSSMVKRTARKGGNAGGEFWGCSKFPTCRGVQQLG